MGKTYKMYERLIEEMKRAKIPKKRVAEYIEVAPSNFSKMLYGCGGKGARCSISLERAIAIQERFFPELSVNELFMTKEYEV